MEYWIPAEQLSEFNTSLQGTISIEAAFFGESFLRVIPQEFGLRGKNAVQQFVTMSQTLDYSPMDFDSEVSASRKAVYLNLLFWAQFDDFNVQGVDAQQRDATIARLRDAWESNHIEIPLPACH